MPPSPKPCPLLLIDEPVLAEPAVPVPELWAPVPVEPVTLVELLQPAETAPPTGRAARATNRSARVKSCMGGSFLRRYWTWTWQVHPASPVMHALLLVSRQGMPLQHGEVVEHCWP